ncbi:tyrosine-protein kinase [Pedobacter sp. B4-66]|uniref:GumC family protein n=1 Tax=Pedobacter sp. B4-66 TaxID=2817280 RepID=UPI001BD957D7|nr:tyrosine-protein kinase [Pedobacter sp. B4-66]
MQNEFSRPFKIRKEVNYIKLLNVILSKWHWLLCALAFGLISGYLYLLIVPPLYATTASLKFEEKKSEISELMNVRNLYDKTNKVESEKLVIRSRNVLLKAINSLDCEVSFYVKRSFGELSIYPLKPLAIKILANKTSKDSPDEFDFKALSNSDYQLCYELNDKRICEKYKYGQTVSLPYLTFKILRANKLILPKQEYLIRINNVADLLERISNSLILDDGQNINILNLRFTDHNPYFATDLLNAILQEYLEFDKMQRSISVSQTANFINTLLNTMSDTVTASAKVLQKYRESNGVLSISSNATLLSNRLTELETEKHTLEIQNVIVKFLEKDLTNTEHIEKLNYSLQGITDPHLNGFISKYNDLLISKKTALNTYTPSSEVVIRINNQLADLKEAILNNISTQIKSNTKTRSFLSKQIDSIFLVRAKIPKTERDFITLQSKFEINQKIHSYLEEKKLEAQISKAAVIPGSFIIDKAEYPIRPILPIPKNTYTIFTLASLFLGTALIVMVRVLNPYIYNKESIEELTTIPIIGIINRHKQSSYESNKQIQNIKEFRSAFSESVRSVRSNLSFLASEKNSKTICITSEISGEGKSFVSLNLAYSLTLINKKVLLVAADLRKSKLHHSLNTSNQNGLSKYLSGQAALADILVKTSIENLDFISSGPVPPNPSELLHSSKMQALINDLKDRYDFILLDSAPIGLVTDSKPLIKMADINLFILRCGVSKYEFAETPERLQREFNLTDIAIILNDFEDNNFHRSFTMGKRNSYHKDYYYSSQANYAHHKDYFEL